MNGTLHIILYHIFNLSYPQSSYSLLYKTSNRGYNKSIAIVIFLFSSMIHNPKLRIGAFLVFTLIVFFSAYFIGNFAPVVNTDNNSLPQWEGFNDPGWRGSLYGTVVSARVVNESEGIGVATIENENKSATLTLLLKPATDPGQQEVVYARRTVGAVDSNALISEPVPLTSLTAGTEVELMVGGAPPALEVDVENLSADNVVVEYIYVLDN